MSSSRFPLAAAVLCLCLGPRAADAQVVPGAPPTDWSVAQNEFRLAVLREYNTLISSWHDALNADDAAALATDYTATAMLLVSGRAAVQGRDSIADLLGSFAQELIEIRTGVADFLASDRLAFATGPMLCRFKVAASGGERTVTGHHVTVLLREGRRWRIHSQVLQYEPGETPGT
jgi:ketosteroid isomerase-like protein